MLLMLQPSLNSKQPSNFKLSGRMYWVTSSGVHQALYGGVGLSHYSTHGSRYRQAILPQYYGKSDIILTFLVM